jgi:hypothetical protein
MAQNGTPIFTPPMNSLIKEDPQIVRVPLDYTEFGARPSSVNAADFKSNIFPVRNLPNGQ